MAEQQRLGQGDRATVTGQKSSSPSTRIDNATLVLHTRFVEDHDDVTNRLFRALGDATRRQIIDELSIRDRQSLFEIYTRVVTQYDTGLSRQAFSRHLSVLEDVGIVKVEWQGTTKLHSLDIAPIVRLRGAWLSRFGGNG